MKESTGQLLRKVRRILKTPEGGRITDRASKVMGNLNGQYLCPGCDYLINDFPCWNCEFNEERW